MFDVTLEAATIAARCIAAILCWFLMGAGAVAIYRHYRLRRFKAYVARNRSR